MANSEGGQAFWDSVGREAKKLKQSAQQSVNQASQFVTKAATDVGETVSQSASQVTQSVTKTAAEWGDSTSNPIAQKVGQAVSNATGKHHSMNETFELSKVSEQDRLAFYGALFAIATADGHLDKDEMELVFSIMDLEGMAEDAKRQVQSYVITPPPLWGCLSQLSSTTDEKLRFSLMVNLVDTAWANDELDPDEEKAILLAQKELNVTDEQLEAIKTFIQKVREIRVRGLDDNFAADAIKTAAAGLSAVGVPVAAIWFSGSVIGLSAAGITSGLAGLGALVGLGGMIPGIGVAILLGAGIFMGVNALLDTGDNARKAQHQAEKERKAQLVIKNMQDAMSQLIEQIASLQEKALKLESSAADAEANREAIKLLTERLRFMQQSVTRRKQAFGVA